MTTCANPEHKHEIKDRGHVPHEIADGDRKISIDVHVTWGADDLRGDWEGQTHFCSFGCLEEWATAKAVDHDRRTIKEGTP